MRDLSLRIVLHFLLNLFHLKISNGAKLKAILSHKSDEIQLSLGLAGSFECLFLL